MSQVLKLLFIFLQCYLSLSCQLQEISKSTQFLIVGDILRHCKTGINIFRDTNLTKGKIDNASSS